MPMQQKQNIKGFSLIELLVVIAIISIIAGIGFFQMTTRDMPIILIIALAITIQFPFYISMLYFGTPLFILDYFYKKRKVSLDKRR